MTNYKKPPIARPGISNKFTLHIGICCSLYLLNIQKCHPRNDGLAWTLSQKVLFMLFWLFFFYPVVVQNKGTTGFTDTKWSFSFFLYKSQSNTGVTQQACISCSWMQPTTAVTGMMKGTQTQPYTKQPCSKTTWWRKVASSYDVQAVSNTLWEY